MPEDAHWSRSVTIKRVSNKVLTIDGSESVPDDIDTGYWRIDLMPNEQALHNVVTSIGLVAAAENTPMHMLTVRNPLVESMTLKKYKEQRQMDVSDQELERLNIW